MRFAVPRPRLAGGALLLGLLMTDVARAGVPVAVWTRRIGNVAGTATPTGSRLRVLPERSILASVGDGRHVHRLDRNGSPLGLVELSAWPRFQLMEIGADGTVVGLSYPLEDSSSSGELCAIDGWTGRGLWRAGFPFAERYRDRNAEARVLEDGDVLGTVLRRVPAPSGYERYDLVAVRLDGSTGAARWGPRTLLSGVDSASATTDGQDLLVVTDQLGIHAFDLKSGARRWDVALPYAHGAIPDPGRSVIASWYPSSVVKLDSSTGRIEWTASGLPGTLLHVDPAGDVFVDGYFELLKLSGSTGEILWRITHPPSLQSRRAFLDGKASLVLFATGPEGLTVEKVTPTGGIGYRVMVRAFELPGALVPLDDDRDAVLFGGSRLIALLSPVDGGLLRELQPLPQPAPPEASLSRRIEIDGAGGILASDDFGGVARISVRDGSTLWRREHLVAAWEPILAARDALGGAFVVAEDEPATVSRLRASTGEVDWRTELPASSASLVASEPGAVYVSGADVNTGASRLVVLDAVSGGPLFDIPDPAGQWRPDGREGLLVLDLSGGLSRLELATGRSTWERPGVIARDSFWTTSLAVARGGDAVLVTRAWRNGRYALRVARYSGRNGEIVFGPVELDLPNTSGFASVLGVNDDVFVAALGLSAPSVPVILKLDGKTGRVVWGPVSLRLAAWERSGATWSEIVVASTDPSLGSSDLVLAGSTVGGDLTLAKIDGRTGERVWSLPAGVRAWPSDMQAAAGADLVVALSDGTLTRFGGGLGLEPAELRPAVCGVPYTASLPIRNARGPALLELVSGRLPNGLSLDAYDESIRGVPSPPGTYAFRLRASDASGAIAEKDLELTIAAGPPIRVLAEPEASGIAPGSPVTLSAPDGYSSYVWSPGGETSRTILAHPLSTTTYSVSATTEPTGCVSRGTIQVRPLPPETLAAPVERLIPCARQARGERTEVVLTNLGDTTADVILRGGGAERRLLLPAGTARVLPDLAGELVSLGARTEGASECLSVTVVVEGLHSLEDVALTTRSVACGPSGEPCRAHSAPVLDPGTLASSPVLLPGLRATPGTRLVLANAGRNREITVRARVFSIQGKPPTLPDTKLGPGESVEIPLPLTTWGMDYAHARVERISGDEPFLAMAVTEADTAGAEIVVAARRITGETAPYFPVTLGDAERPVELTLAAVERTDFYVTFRSPSRLPASRVLTLGENEVRHVLDVEAFLRRGGPARTALETGLLEAGGPARARAVLGTAETLELEPASDHLLSASEGVVVGLREGEGLRADLVLQGVDDARATIEGSVVDGDSGAVVGLIGPVSLGGSSRVEVGSVLASYGIRNGWVRLRRTEGRGRFLAFGVLHDEATADASFLSMIRR